MDRICWRTSSHSRANGDCVQIAVLSMDCWNRNHPACTDPGCGCGCHIPDGEAA